MLKILAAILFPLAGLLIGIIHKKPEYGKTRKMARMERHEQSRAHKYYMTTGRYLIKDH